MIFINQSKASHFHFTIVKLFSEIHFICEVFLVIYMFLKCVAFSENRETPYEMSHLLLAIVFKLGELVSYA